MTYKPDNLLPDDTSVRQLLLPIAELLKKPGVTEVCINRPGLVHYEIAGSWEKIEVAELTFGHCLSIAVAVASYTEQALTSENTILGATLSDGERIHVVIPPTCERDTVSITIRVPSPTSRTLKQYDEQGFFNEVQSAESLLSAADTELLDLKAKRRFMEFSAAAVKYRKNIAVVGDTGSGKTTFMKTLCQEIDLADRLVTIEDARELFIPSHDNRVHLLYSAHGKAKATPAALIKSTLRMRPDRVLPAELRGEEAFDFVDLLTTGHNGSITSFHAESAGVAFERFALMCKKHPNANTYTHAELMRLLHLTIDVIVHVERSGGKRFISEIYFDPHKKHGLKHG